MALDAEISDLLKTQIMSDSKLAAQRVNTIAERSMNSLNVIESTVIQAQASVSDDSGLIAALQTAAGAPAQGSHGQPVRASSA